MQGIGKALIVFAITCFLLPVACQAQEGNFVRVAIVRDAASLSLKIRGSYQIESPGAKKILSRGRDLNVTVTGYGGGILLGSLKADCNSVLINADGAQSLVIDGRRYKGRIQLFKKDKARLLATNIIALEDYVKGILYHEASHYWPQEVLKAQAIASRTYVWFQKREALTKDFDVTSDIYSQVYGGFSSERQRTNSAVEETKGYVLTYQGKVFPAYFHATCGGHTEDAALLWNINLPTLKGAFCHFCKESPHFNWHFVLSEKELRDKLAAGGYKLERILGISPKGRDPSGRITELKISSLIKEISLSAKDLRGVLGPNEIKSTNFEVTLAGNDVVFEGVGWGHGVGMCQWGAYFMAKAGGSCKEILQYYYPQAELTLLL